MHLILIAAVLHNHVIGRGPYELVWSDKRDMRHLVALTSGHAVAMGRNTWESIPARYRPLLNRLNIVITSQDSIVGPSDGVLLARSLDHAIELATIHGHTTLYIMGGEQLYREAIVRANRLEITHVNLDLEGDRFFPEIDPAIWVPTTSEPYETFTFTTYERRPTNVPATDHLPRGQ